jgi:hypothetical protein
MKNRISWSYASSLGTIVCLIWSQQTTVVQGGILVNALFSEYAFPSVRYFEFGETKWPDFDEVLNGRVAVMRSLNLNRLFAELESYEGNRNEISGGNATVIGPTINVDDDFGQYEWVTAPKFLVVNLGEAAFEDAMRNASLAAEKMQADFVVLIVGTTSTWKERFAFWWSHRFPGCRSLTIPPGGNSTHRYFFMAVDRWTGQEIMELLEQDARYFGNYSSEEFYFGVDKTDAMEGRELILRLWVYFLWVFVFSRYIANGNRNNVNADSAPNSPAYTGDDLGMGEVQSSSDAQDCPVCLETMQPGETVRILPCRHILHHDCITGWFQHGKLTCPLCNMDLAAHLEEQRNASLDIIQGTSSRYRWWTWPCRRGIRNLEAQDQLIAPRRGHGSSNGDDGTLGDLELTEGNGVLV